MQNIKYKLILLVVSISAALLPTKAIAAARITFNINPFGQFQIKVNDLETFATKGSSTAELDYYLHRLPPEQLARLPKLLSTPLEFEPLTIAKFSNSTVGEIFLKNLGKGIRNELNHNGFYALRGAMIAAAFDPQGLTLINLLRHYPSKTVYLDLGVLTQYLELTATLEKNREIINRLWFVNQHQQTLKQNRDSLRQPAKEADLKIPGPYHWQKRTLVYENPHRHMKGLFDLYQPKNDDPTHFPLVYPIPVIAISHGVASNRRTFAYLAKHLASQGFAVAVIEHNEMSLAKFDRFLSGEESFPEANNLIDQPLDISFVLDRLALEKNLDLERVGIVGQSFGGYSGLALAGGALIPEANKRVCQTENYSEVVLDLSSLAKCSFNQLQHSPVKLRDSRVKAVIAINPMAKIFGSAGMSQIDIPTMIISGIDDPVMFPVAEQIEPFSWLKDQQKFLVLVKPGTHFSFLQENLGVLPVPDDFVGPRPIYAYPALKALSTAFFQVYLTRQSAAKTYLQSDRVEQLNNDAFKLSIIRNLKQTELEQFED